MKPHLCMIFEAIGNQSAIAKIAMTDIRIALAAGFRVTVVAQQLDVSLLGRVEWLKLYVPPRLFFLKWVTARSFMKAALGGRKFDIVHAHQPQAASLSDVFQCHFLTRMAYERKCLESRRGLRPLAIRIQEQGVLYAEDYFYSHWNPSTYMVFDSEGTRKNFTRLYGLPPRQELLVGPFPELNFANDAERIAAREKLVGKDFKGIVLGYLGGIQRRKGYERLVQSLENEPDIFLLMGGQYTDTFQPPASLAGRFRGMGHVSNTDEFYAACDVIAMPSFYEPMGLVAFEAASRGVPVVMTPEVGALHHMVQYNVGDVWPAGAALGPIVRHWAQRRPTILPDVTRMQYEQGSIGYGRRLLDIYDEILHEKRDRPLHPVQRVPHRHPVS